MKALAIFGSLAVFGYVFGVMLLTSVNVSRAFFDLCPDQEGRRGFWSRQGLIFLWPLAMLSENGRNAFALIWAGDEE